MRRAIPVVALAVVVGCSSSTHAPAGDAGGGQDTGPVVDGGASLDGTTADGTTGSDGATDEMRARFPLRDAAVEVREVAGRPGALACTVRLQPHFQLDSIATSFRLVTDVSGQRQ